MKLPRFRSPRDSQRPACCGLRLAAYKTRLEHASPSSERSSRSHREGLSLLLASSWRPAQALVSPFRWKLFGERRSEVGSAKGPSHNDVPGRGPMSRSKRARAKDRKRGAMGQIQKSVAYPAKSRPAAESARPVTRSATPPTLPEVAPARLASARRRGRRAKVGIGAAAMISAGASMGFARVTYAGHSKHPVRALSIPQPLYVVVRQNLLQAGILAPATAPPDVTTSTS